MKWNLLYYMICLILFSASFSFADNVVIGGHFGLPCLANFNLGYVHNNYILDLSGFYGNRDDNSIIGEGIQIEASRFLAKGKFSHRASALIGYVQYKNDPSRVINYFGVAYALSWKYLYIQPGLGVKILNSTYDEVNDLFGLLNIGVSFKLINL